MTGMLASVTCAEEALLALEEGADIIDLKDPSRGALGALAGDILRKVIRAVGGRRPVSATIGDMVSMDPREIARAVESTARTGVDYVKVGFFPASSMEACAEALAAQAAAGTRIVAVLFGDRQPDFGLLPHLARHGFAGVMLDTAGKNGKSLRESLTDPELAGFVREAKLLRMITGLAGSLKNEDIPPLLGLEPDYLGFRGALCAGAQRTGTLERASIASVRRLIDRGAGGHGYRSANPQRLSV